MSEKTYTLNLYGRDHKIALRKSHYANNNTIAIFMVEINENGYEEPWSNLTVNISDSDILANESLYAFIDTNHNGEEITKWLVKNKIATNAGVLGFSGFCSYPLFRFEPKVISEMKSL